MEFSCIKNVFKLILLFLFFHSSFPTSCELLFNSLDEEVITYSGVIFIEKSSEGLIFYGKKYEDITTCNSLTLSSGTLSFLLYLKQQNPGIILNAFEFTPILLSGSSLIPKLSLSLFTNITTDSLSPLYLEASCSGDSSEDPQCTEDDLLIFSFHIADIEHFQWTGFGVEYECQDFGSAVLHIVRIKYWEQNEDDFTLGEWSAGQEDAECYDGGIIDPGEQTHIFQFGETFEGEMFYFKIMEGEIPNGEIPMLEERDTNYKPLEPSYPINLPISEERIELQHSCIVPNCAYCKIDAITEKRSYLECKKCEDGYILIEDARSLDKQCQICDDDATADDDDDICMDDCPDGYDLIGDNCGRIRCDFNLF